MFVGISCWSFNNLYLSVVPGNEIGSKKHLLLLPSLDAGNNTNNLVERQFKVILEEVLGRTTAHSAGHLTSLLCQDYEKALRSKLLDSAHGRRRLTLKVQYHDVSKHFW